jgi:hypothetical protein
VQALAEEAESKGLDSPGLHFGSYLLAFLNCDAAGMAKQVERSMGKPGMEETLLSSEGETNACSWSPENGSRFLFPRN